MLKELLGLGLDVKDLNYYQMIFRAMIVFFIALVYIRIAGMRTFGKNTAIDVIIGLILGSVLSRAINGSAPFGPTLAASLTLVLMHRLLAFVTYKSHKLGSILKGEPSLLVLDGEIQWDNMRANSITEHDLMEGIRKQAEINNLSQVKEAYFERTGEISVIKK